MANKGKGKGFETNLSILSFVRSKAR